MHQLSGETIFALPVGNNRGVLVAGGDDDLPRVDVAG
jgi:hypothetical protein